MFDVAHVVAGQRFEVVTDHLVATAKGTVFSVETDAVRSRVRVYEGIVEVEQAGQTHALIAGAVWDSATETTNIALAEPPALAPSIEVALRERAKDDIRPSRENRAPAANPPPTTIVATNPPITHRAPRADIVATKDVPITAPWSTDSVPLAKLSPTQLLATARADLETGKFGDALDAAKLATPWNGAWWQVVADAHRGAGDTAAAADAYDHAAKQLTGADRNEAGYSAAYLRFRELHRKRRGAGVTRCCRRRCRRRAARRTCTRPTRADPRRTRSPRRCHGDRPPLPRAVPACRSARVHARPHQVRCMIAVSDAQTDGHRT